MKMKPWIIAGVSCLCAGTICCGAAVCAGALDQNRYRENLHLIDQTDTPSETFTSVLMDVDNAEVTVQNGSKFSITAENVPQNSYHVAVEDDTLQIQLNSDSEPWYSYTHFGFHPFHAPAARSPSPCPPNTEPLPLPTMPATVPFLAFMSAPCLSIWTTAIVR